MARGATEAAHTTNIGRRGEQAAAEYLQQQDFTVLQRNWRRRDCEIDLICYKGRSMYFVEVKYRASNRTGHGLEYVTPRKLHQMAYAARRWMSEHQWRGVYALSAIEVSGPAYQVTAFIENIALR